MKLRRLICIVAVLAAVALCEAQTFDYPTRMVDGQEVYEYPVKKGEGLYRISVTFGVTQEELLRLNPELKTEGLKLGQVILVPVKKAAPKKEAVPVKKVEVRAAKADSVLPKEEPKLAKQTKLPLPAMAKQEPVTPAAPYTSEEVFFEEDTMFVVQPETAVAYADTLRLALLLPLQADAQSYDVKMERFLKFYEGVLLALREEKREGWKYEVYVYDIGKSEYKLMKVLEQPEMERMHAIIGPAYANQIAAAGTFVRNRRILCLLPFTNGVEGLESNKYLLQYNPTVPEGMRVVQFKKGDDGSWDAFDELMSRYFHANPTQSRPRYDILGYDLAKYFIPAVLNARKAQNEEAWQQAIETEYDGLQSTMRFKRVGEGGFMNTPLRLIPKVTAVPQENNAEETK